MGLALEAVIPDLSAGKTYFFTATARNTAGLESLPALAISHTIPDVVDGSESEGGAGGSEGGGSVGTIPSANSFSIVTDAGKPIPITLTGTDLLGAILTFMVTVPPNHGTLTGDLPDLVYTPDPGFSGVDDFGFLVNNGLFDSSVATISVLVRAPNQAPTALAKTATVLEDGLVSILLGGTDPEGSPLDFDIVVQPVHGTLGGAPPNLTYRPVANYFGSDSFEYTVGDGALTSTRAAVSITVSPVNDAPVAVPQSVSVPRGGSVPVVLASQDVEGGVITFSVARHPAHGVLNGTPPSLTYVPAAQYVGSDSFDFRVMDSAGATGVATVQVLVTGVNQPPSAVPLAATVPEDGSVAIKLAGTDPDGDSLTFATATTGMLGILTGTPPNLVYRPPTNYFGADSFEYAVSDGDRISARVVVSISVTSVNDAPTAKAQAVRVGEDGSLPIVLSGTDADGPSPIAYSIARAPANGTLSGTPPAVTYQPKPNFFGSDSFDFRVADGAGAAAVARVDVTVDPVNDRPVANAITVTVPRNGVGTIVLSGSDVENSTLAYIMNSQPASGALSGTPPNLTYRPAQNFSGSDSFTYSTSDGSLTSVSATVSIQVLSGNTAPTATSVTLTSPEDSSLPIVLKGVDAENDPLSFSIVTGPANGALTGTPPNVRYLPKTDYSGLDSFTFRVADNQGSSSVGTVQIQVESVNDSPVATPQSLTVPKNGVVSFVLAGTDVEGSALSFAVGDPTAHGVLSGTPPNLTYRPNSGYSGPDSFEFAVSDGDRVSNRIRVPITVTPGNTAPVALAQSVSAQEDVPLPITLQGQDVDGDALTYAVVGQPGNGSLSGTPPNLVYLGATNYFGPDSFTFRVSDGEGTSGVATVLIAVDPVNDAPVAYPQQLTVQGGSEVSFVLEGSDTEGVPLYFGIAVQPIHGTLLGTAPSLIYRPNPGYAGEDSFEFGVNDGVRASSRSTVTILVTSSNRAPVPDSRSYTVAQGSSVAFPVTATDADGDALTYAIVRYPANGYLAGNLPGNVIYWPYSNYSGPDSFQFVARDGTTTSEIGVISLTVTPVNSAPRVTSSSFVTTYGTPVAVNLTGSDPEGGALTFRVIENPSNGVLSGTPPALTYTPATGFTGVDLFRVVANDGALDSTPRAITIEVNLVLATSGSPVTIPTGSAGGDTAADAGDPVGGDSPLGISGDGGLAGGDGNLRPTGHTLVADPGSEILAPPSEGAGDAITDLQLGDRPPFVPGGNGGATLKWGVLPVHGVVTRLDNGDVVYEHAGDGSTLDSFTVLRAPSEGAPEEEIPISLHIVGIRSVQRFRGQAEVSFPTLLGLTYRLEMSDGSPSQESNWATFQEIRPTVPGIVTIPVPAPPLGQSRFLRVACSGGGQQVVSEVWGLSDTEVLAGVDGRVYSLPFRGGTALRAKVSSIVGGALDLQAGVVQFPNLVGAGGLATHAIFVRSTPQSGGQVGVWWPVIGQNGSRIHVDERIESVADCLADGDEVEIVRLLTVAEVFGAAESKDAQLDVGDRLRLEGFGGETYQLEYRLSNRTTGAYWVVRGGVETGPHDGTGLPLLPFQAFYFSNRSKAGKLMMTGRVQTDAAVHYLVEGAQMAGNAFPVPAEVPELGPYRLAEGDLPWVEDGSSGATIGPVGPWATGTGGLSVGGGIWVRIPEGMNAVRWVQQRPW